MTPTRVASSDRRLPQHILPIDRTSPTIVWSVRMRRMTSRLSLLMFALGLGCSSPSTGDGSGGTANAGGAAGTGGAVNTVGAGGSAAGTKGGAGGASGSTGGTSGGTGGTNPEGGTTPDQICADSASAICETYRACIPTYFSQWYGDMDTCVTTLAAISCRFRLNAPGTGDTPATIAACAAARRVARCPEIFENEVVACLPQRGTLANGAKCATSSQCQSQYCTLAFGSDCGTCAPTVAAGGKCTGAVGECAGSLQCVSGVCGTHPKVGEDCTFVPCRFGLACPSGLCREPAKAGESCASNWCDTRGDLVCRNDICERWQYVGSGERCDIEVGPHCSRASICKASPGSTSGTCLPPAAEGQACDEVTGPACVPWTNCRMGVCKVPDSTSCK